MNKKQLIGIKKSFFVLLGGKDIILQNKRILTPLKRLEFVNEN